MILRQALVCSAVRSFAAAVVLFGLTGSGSGAQTASQQLVLGNPSEATADAANKTNYLIRRPEYALSYNSETGCPNWVSWHVSKSDLGKADRSEAFATDTSLPAGFYRVTKNDYRGTGYDRGHNCPSADRTKTVTHNVATFLMTNMSPQSPTVNRLGRAWESLETYTRDLVKQGNEVYVICGGQGESGEIAHGKVKVPAYIWKVIVVLPDKSGSDLTRITSSTRVIAVMIPNEKGNVDKNWRHHRTTVSEIEAVTGLNLLSKVPAAIQEALESKVDEG